MGTAEVRRPPLWPCQADWLDKERQEAYRGFGLDSEGLVLFELLHLFRFSCMHRDGIRKMESL